MLFMLYGVVYAQSLRRKKFKPDDGVYYTLHSIGVSNDANFSVSESMRGSITWIYANKLPSEQDTDCKSISQVCFGKSILVGLFRKVCVINKRSVLGLPH